MNVLEELKKVNRARSLEAFKDDLHDLKLSQWSNAVAGEAGELCNIVKKVERGDYHKGQGDNTNGATVDWFAKQNYRRDISKEAADIVIYLDLLCTREGIDLGQAIIEKFNEVSDKMKCDIKIPSY